MKPSALRPIALAPLAAAALILSSLALPSACSKAEPQTPLDIQTARMAKSEANLLSWNKTGYLSPLGKGAMNLEWPSAAALDLFEDSVQFSGLVERFPSRSEEYVDGAVGVRAWQTADEVQELAKGDLNAYESLFANIDYFKKAKFKIHLPVPGWLDPGTEREWYTSLLFTGKAVMKDGTIGHVEGWSDVSWRLQPESYKQKDPDKQTWRVFEWRIRSMKVTETDDYLFDEVLAQAVPDPAALSAARRSLHLELVRDVLKGDAKRPSREWMIPAGERHPTVVVCDYDGDGWDDFYCQERIGKNLFFRNNGDGTFDEIAEEIGLAFDGNTSSTMFADFDNDGDLDAFVGGTLDRSRYLENVDGRYLDRSGDNVATEDLPYHVSALAAVDYDGDGLLDVYASTYTAFFVQRALNFLAGEAGESVGTGFGNFRKEDLEALEPFLADEDWKALRAAIVAESERNGFFTDRCGAPNVLLRNLGDGRFAVAEDARNLRIMRNTYQTTWADIDDDGDQDLYCANDFAPNNLFRNDGDGVFTEITEQAQVADVGFGMGVTWGDYDGDQRQDLYITNMYSKASRRVTSFFVEDGRNFDAELVTTPLSPLVEQMGAGNSLFRNLGEAGWEKVSGTEKPALVVEPGGWGWGAQFADFDNDGWLDIYAPAGYYTAPKEAKIDVDL